MTNTWRRASCVAATSLLVLALWLDPLRADPAKQYVAEEAWLGIACADLDLEQRKAIKEEQPSGCRVTQVWPGSPAEKKGLSTGSVIVAIDGTNVRDADHLYGILRQHRPDDLVRLRLWAEGRYFLALRLAVSPLARCGLSVDTLDARAAGSAKLPAGSPVVTSVAEGSPAAVAGLRSGDVLLKIGTENAATLPELYRGLASLASPTLTVAMVAVTYSRDGTTRSVLVKVTAPEAVLPAPKSEPVQAQYNSPSVPAPAKKAWLGTGIKKLTPQDAGRLKLPSANGVLVFGISPASPAERAGVKTDDVIVTVDGAEVSEASQIAEKVREAGINGQVTLGIIRAGAAHSIAVALGEIGGEDVDGLLREAAKAISQERNLEAEKLYLQAFGAAEKILPANHPTLASIGGNLGRVYYRQGRFADAEPLAKRELDALEKAVPPDEKDVATSLENLAAVYDALKRYSEAETTLKRALPLRERTLGPAHPRVAGLLMSLGTACYKDGRPEDAVVFFRRAIALYEMSGQEDADVVEALNGLARAYSAQGRMKEAEPYYQRAVAITNKLDGSDASAPAGDTSNTPDDGARSASEYQPTNLTRQTPGDRPQNNDRAAAPDPAKSASKYKADRPWLGAFWRTLNKNDILGRRAPRGFPGAAPVVVSVVEGSPAHVAGLRPGDVVSVVKGRIVFFPWELEDALQRLGPYETIKLTVWKDGRRDETWVEIQLAVDPLSRLGLKLAELDADTASRLKVPKGALSIQEIASGSPAQEVHLQVGDVLLAVDGMKTDSLVQVYEALERGNRKVGISVSLDVLRSGEAKTFSLVPAATASIAATGGLADGSKVVTVVTNRATGQTIKIACRKFEEALFGGDSRHVRVCSAADGEFAVALTAGEEVWCDRQRFAVHDNGFLGWCRLKRPYIGMLGGRAKRCAESIDFKRTGEVAKCE